jgi:hypothetical protein
MQIPSQKIRQPKQEPQGNTTLSKNSDCMRIKECKLEKQQHNRVKR